MIPKEIVDKIFETAVIEDVIGDFVNLKRSGSSYKARSPFTEEKTPSFFVVPHKGIFKCFSSGKGGNVVNFLMEHEKLSYPEALRWLADRYNIEVPEVEESPEQQEIASEKESLALITAFAQEYFSNYMFNTEEGQAVGLSYFTERGFREDTIRKFQLGFCPDKWDQFTQDAMTKGYALKFLIQSGLSKDRDGSPYDFFRGRVMFPICNVAGKVIAFGGRTLRTDKKVAKYFNSPESLLYNKSRVLYGIHLAKGPMVKLDSCYIVEGYTDVISLHQSGVENVVASAGTALTDDQIKLIKRYTRNVTILFDGDAAGIKASFRGIDMLLSQGMNVRVVAFPDGEDPDSFARKTPSTELNDFLKNQADDFIVFKTNLLSKEAAGDPVKRGGMVRDIVESIALIPDMIQRSVYIQECSRLMGMEEAILTQEMNKVVKRELKKSGHVDRIPDPVLMPPQQPQQERGIQIEHQERDLIRLLLNYGQHIIHLPAETEEPAEPEEITVSEYLIHEVEVDHLTFSKPEYTQIITEYASHLDEERFPEEKYFATHHDQLVSTLCANLITDQYTLSDNWELKHSIYPEKEESLLLKAVQDCVARLRLRNIQVMMHELNEKLKNPELTDEDLARLMQRKIRLDKAKMVLSAYFGTTILDH
ncbi:MAG: DNA primase [Flavobacteriales bacterium]|nr:DNA primase [Flavobacteriales bacterium]